MTISVNIIQVQLYSHNLLQEARVDLEIILPLPCFTQKLLTEFHIIELHDMPVKIRVTTTIEQTTLHDYFYKVNN